MNTRSHPQKNIDFRAGRSTAFASFGLLAGAAALAGCGGNAGNGHTVLSTNTGGGAATPPDRASLREDAAGKDVSAESSSTTPPAVAPMDASPSNGHNPGPEISPVGADAPGSSAQSRGTETVRHEIPGIADGREVTAHVFSPMGQAARNSDVSDSTDGAPAGSGDSVGGAIEGSGGEVSASGLNADDSPRGIDGGDEVEREDGGDADVPHGGDDDRKLKGATAINKKGHNGVFVGDDNDNVIHADESATANPHLDIYDGKGGVNRIVFNDDRDDYEFRPGKRSDFEIVKPGATLDARIFLNNFAEVEFADSLYRVVGDGDDVGLELVELIQRPEDEIDPNEETVTSGAPSPDSTDDGPVDEEPVDMGASEPSAPDTGTSPDTPNIEPPVTQPPMPEPDASDSASNRAPEISASVGNREVEVGQDFHLDLNAFFTDPDGDPLTFGETDHGPGVASIGLSFDYQTGVIEGTITSPGEVSVNALAYDGREFSASYNSFGIIATAPDPADETPPDPADETPPDPAPDPPGKTITFSIVTNDGDTIVGGENNDLMFGLDGDDILIGNGGDDLISGGNSVPLTGDPSPYVDTVVYRYDYSEYEITAGERANVIIVKHVGPSGPSDGEDTVTDVDRIQFSDRVITVSNDPESEADIVLAAEGGDFLRAPWKNEIVSFSGDDDLPDSAENRADSMEAASGDDCCCCDESERDEAVGGLETDDPCGCFL